MNEGPDIIEYALILVIVAIVTIVIFALLGPAIENIIGDFLATPTP